MACAPAFTADIANSDADAGDVADGAAFTAHTFHVNRFTCPSVKAEDTVGFCNGVPSLDVAESATAATPSRNVFLLERCS